MRKLQIGVIGSNNLDLNNEQDKAAWDFAYKIGFNLGRAVNSAVLTIGKGGVSEAVTKGVNDSGGISVSILPSNYKEDGNPESHVNIASTLDNYQQCWPFVYSCDCIIAIGGGIETGIIISLAVDLGLHVVIYSKAGGISAEVFTSLEPAFQKMRSSQLVYLVENTDEALDRAKKFATDRVKKEIRIEDKIEIDIPTDIEFIFQRHNLAILLLLEQRKSISPQEIADTLKIPYVLAKTYIQELDSREIILAKKTIGDEHLFSINQDNQLIRKLLNVIAPKKE